MADTAGDAHSAPDVPNPNEIYCPHCGEITPKGGAICGYCGGPLQSDAQSRMSPAKLEQWGKNATGLAYFLSPIIFAPIAFYLGHKLRRYDEEAGMKIIGYAIGSIILWGLLVQLFL